MDRALAVSATNGKKSPSDISIDPSCSMNNVDEDEDWVMVKRQRVTILVPAPSPERPQAGSPKIRSKQTGLTKNSSRSDHTARKKHPKRPTGTKKSGSSPENVIEVNGESKKSQANPSEGTVHEDVPRMRAEIYLHGPAAPVVESVWTNGGGHAVQRPQQNSDEEMISCRYFDKPMLPIVASNVAKKVMQARLLQRQVAGFGGLRNWLITCDLGRFAQILDGEKLSMYQLVTLTMSQLKEMGFVAVGPRRKLIHAINCLCRPQEFKTTY